ncbi:MAG: (Fe-S)-binding protein [Chromatiales bacterium]|nr:(Fe-S)-binding protein [Chromatiales bacterium]
MYDGKQKLRDKILADSERCVMCGLCLPHCPTFSIKHNEADSPRGRVLLAKALAKGQLQADDHVRLHIESCLHCLHCERVCPAQVLFGTLIDNTEYYLAEQKQATPLPLWLKLLIASRKLRLVIALLIRLYQRSGAQSWLRSRSLFKRLDIAAWDAMLPKRLSLPIKRTTIGADSTDKTVALFSGCVASICDQNTLAAAEKLLMAVGFKVQFNNKQYCCGAIHQHTGDLKAAHSLMLRNTNAFNPSIPVISCASGCGARLQQYNNELSAHHYDIHSFLLKHAEYLNFNKLSKTVALHTPCSMQNVLAQQQAPMKLLSMIPDLRIVSLTPQTGCCGAAGLQIVKHQSQGNTLADVTIDAMKHSDSEILLTSNIGCAMHLRRRIWLRGLNYKVMHPVVLLYQQLQTP